MSENKKYYYMKLKENFFSSERMVVLEMMPDGILYSNLLLKMYLMSLKHNGVLLLHENLPHTPQTIATFTRHQIGTVERALQTKISVTRPVFSAFRFPTGTTTKSPTASGKPPVR